MEQHAESHGCRISFQVEGPADAPALLFINSIASTRELWTRQATAFSGTHRVLRYDARGHGRSSVPKGEYTIEQLGRDALAVLDSAGIDAAHVCGISLGGMTAMWLGIHAPDRIASLTLANTAARLGSVEFWSDRMTLVREQGMTAIADLTMPRWFTEEFRERDPETVRAFRAMVQSCPLEGYLGCCAALRDEDLREQISTISRPVLVVAGSHDPSTPVEGLQFIHERIPASRMITLDAAHLSNVEQAEAFTGALSDVLASQ